MSYIYIYNNYVCPDLINARVKADFRKRFVFRFILTAREKAAFLEGLCVS